MDLMAIAGVAAGGASFSGPNKGFASVGNSGVGLNDLVLDNALDLTDCVIQATPRLATAATCTTTQISDTVKRVQTFIVIAGVPTLSDLVPFDVLIVRR
jgi:hypothetical protein